MSMAKRRKKLKQRLLTYEELDARMMRAKKAGIQAVKVPLYGNVVLDYSAGQARPGFRIRYVGKNTNFTIASVFRTNVGTLYEVKGIGGPRNKPSVRRAVELWMRYTPVFTPREERLIDGDIARYLVRDGTATPVEDRDVPGVWTNVPRAMPPKAEEWAYGGEWNDFTALPNFTRRCRLFATRLRKAMEADDLGEVQLRNHSGWPTGWWPISGNHLQVCTPPSGTRNGRRLVVKVAMHDAESRRFHHVDGDYGIKHCQFIAIEDGKGRHEALRWKSARDAINGIKEWIIGDIYIPGPG